MRSKAELGTSKHINVAGVQGSETYIRSGHLTKGTKPVALIQLWLQASRSSKHHLLYSPSYPELTGKVTLIKVVVLFYLAREEHRNVLLYAQVCHLSHWLFLVFSDCKMFLGGKFSSNLPSQSLLLFKLIR